MKVIKQLKSLSEDVQTLSNDEQKNVKGGLLITCEEKRRTFLGISYTTTTYNIKPNGSLWITMQM
jgi:hypothetical protein